MSDYTNIFIACHLSEVTGGFYKECKEVFRSVKEGNALFEGMMMRIRLQLSL
jgi:hypothetical protein